MPTAIRAEKKTPARSAAKKVRKPTMPVSEKRGPRKSQKKLTREAKQTIFLAAYAVCSTISGAAKAAGVDRRLHHAWMQEDPTYPERFEVAHEESTQALEAEARRRALHGVRRFKFHKGELVRVPLLDDEGREVTGDDGKPIMVPYFEEERSDLLLIFLLKAARPDVYRDNFKAVLEHRGQVGIKVSGVLAIERPFADSKQWEQSA